MQVFSRGSRESIAARFARVLLSSLDCEPGRVLLVTPWLRNVRLPIAGHQASVFGSHVTECSLVELLGRIARVHTVELLIKPPHELLDLLEVERLVNKIVRREHLLREEELAGYTIRDELIADLNSDISELAQSALRQYDTIDVALRLRDEGATVRFVDSLHAKLLWTPVHAYFGSANFTSSGLSVNEELMVEVTDAQMHAQLGRFAHELAQRSTVADAYDLGAVLNRIRLNKPVFISFVERIQSADYPHLSAALQRLAGMLK